MSNMASKRFVVGCTLAGLIVVLILHVVLCLVLCRCPDPVTHRTVAGTGAGSSAGAGDGARTAVQAVSAGSFTIGGSAAEPISPGVRAPLDLSLTNPHDVPMVVTDLRVRVKDVSAPNAHDLKPCAGGDFSVDQAASGLEITVAARSTSTLSSLGLSRATMPHVGMLNRPANQDGCKGASPTLDYTATGTLQR
jgi:hypothetical protein